MKYKISIVNYPLSIIIILFFALPAKAQVTIGKDAIPHSFSLLELRADKVNGGLRLPQLTTDQITAIGATLLGNPSDALDAKGLVVYDTSLDCLDFWNGATWISLCASTCQAPKLGPISSTQDCNGVIGRNGYIYFSVDPVPNVTYKWTLPSGWDIIGEGSGNSISVKLNNVAVGSYTISVTVTNSCGMESDKSTYDIDVVGGIADPC